ncbi:hypothetical protein PENSTE_c017G02667 [Penicillium steckii]|uniref:Cytochrome P450 n=1 Tax=Penicillium steckii TaxID=303698 RepID=A0A1V6SXP5_9EURO|nr:hypothetical protein PENSTE_c017G02667 [Penicillium steckii]
MAEVGGLINAGAETTSIALTNVLEFLLHNPKHLQELREEIDVVLDEDELIAPPPTPAGLPRRTPPEGAQILSEFIPGDTTMDPESRKKMKPDFISFSSGARGCLGCNISYLKQMVVVATIAHRYEFALPSPNFQLVRKEPFNLLVGELPLKIWCRELSFDSVQA